MNKSILIVAPHADDETLGCGGTILRYLKEGFLVHWLLVTSMSKDSGFSDEQINARASEIKQVYEAYGFESIHLLGFSASFCLIFYLEQQVFVSMDHLTLMLLL